MSTPKQIEAFIRATRPPWNVARQAYDWYGMCAGLTYRTILECGGTVPDGPYSSAWAAYLATRIESSDPRRCPPGGVHYWDYTGLASNGQRARWGHVTLDILGGGTDTLSATGHAHEFWNRSAGLISVAAQTARGMKYMGWSRTYGRSNRINITTDHSAGGGGSTPFPEEDDMPYTPEELKAIAKAGAHEAVVGVLRAPEFLGTDAAPGNALKRVLDLKVAPDTGTLAETTGDARRIARRAEDKVDRLARALGVDLTEEIHREES